MPDMILEIKLISDATLGRGDGIAGEVDAEVQHDQYGFPYLSGRTLKGLLVQECADVLQTLPEDKKQEWHDAAAYLFGYPGSATANSGHMIVSDAQLPADLREAVSNDVRNGKLSRQDVLESLTALRRQTAMESSGVPKEHSLRSVRVVLRQTTFRSEIFFDDAQVKKDVKEKARNLLAVCAASLRRLGTGRNRGRGLVETRLLNAKGEPVSTAAFFEEVKA